MVKSIESDPIDFPAIGKPNIIHRQDTIICLDKKSSDFLQGDYLHFPLITPPIVMCS